ncbi:MAG: glycerate kinase, partial [Planctomycetota bacterium]
MSNRHGSQPPAASRLQTHAEQIFQAAIDSVLGDRLMRDVVTWSDRGLHIGPLEWSTDQIDRLIVVGAGKASGAMASGLATAIGDRLPMVGHVNVPSGQVDWPVPPTIRLHAARPDGLNEPTPAAIAGTDSIVRLIRQATDRDRVIALISGGGSALLCKPAGMLTLDDQLAVIRHLSGAGADITQINVVRKHLSDVKGGRLAMSLAKGRMAGLILSDVLGDPLDLIASGPTVPDQSQVADAIEILSRFDPQRQLPKAIWQHLEHELNSTSGIAFPHDRVDTLVVGNNAVAVDAAGIKAESLGYNHIMHSAKKVEGLAEDVGRHFADMVVGLLRDQASHRHDALITGGEPVVELCDSAKRGVGGRNQQLVLAAYLRLLEHDLTMTEWQKICLLSGGTDGE